MAAGASPDPAHIEDGNATSSSKHLSELTGSRRHSCVCLLRALFWGGCIRIRVSVLGARGTQKATVLGTVSRKGSPYCPAPYAP